jgi:hypothetical protein
MGFCCSKLIYSFNNIRSLPGFFFSCNTRGGLAFPTRSMAVTATISGLPGSDSEVVSRGKISVFHSPDDLVCTTHQRTKLVPCSPHVSREARGTPITERFGVGGGSPPNQGEAGTSAGC